MKSSSQIPHGRLAQWVGACSLALVLGAAVASQGAVLYRETFETDGEGVRWTSESRGVSEDPASGPSFWGLNYGPQAPSFVGVRAIAPARRAGMVWHHTLPEADISQDVLQLFDCAVKWLTSNRTSRVVLFSPPPAGPGDDALVNRLMTNGFTVVNDDTTMPPPDAATIALVIQSSSGIPDPTRFTVYAAPLLSYNGPNHDDELISTIGSTVTTDLGTILMNTATNHPARGGKTNSFVAATGSHAYDVLGSGIPAGAVSLANYELVNPRLLVTLADADAAIANTIESLRTTGTVAVADFSVGEGGRFTGQPQYDNAVPGNPDPARTFAIRATGKIQVSTPGTWTFALPVDDAARLRIDRNRNGFDAGDNVFNEEDATGLRVASNNVVFAEAGVYNIEWVTLCTGNNFGQEIAVAKEPGGTTPVEPWDPFNFDLLGEHDQTAKLKLMGELTVVVAVPTAVSRTQVPFLIVVDTGGALLGGPLTGFEGRGFWGGADLNDVDYGTPSTDSAGRTLTLPRTPVNVAGLGNARLVLLLAGSDVDFENNDFLKIYCDPDGPGPRDFEILAEYRGIGGGPMGDTLNNGTPRNYILRGFAREVSYPLPTDATAVVIRFEGHCTFFNEVMAWDDVRIVGGVDCTPTVRIARNGPNGARLTYTGTLECAPTVRGPWTVVTNASPIDLVATEFVTKLDGGQDGGEGRTGGGQGTLTLSGNTLTFNGINYSGLSGTVRLAHIHGPAGPGAPGGVLYDLIPGVMTAGGSSGTMSGSITLVDKPNYTVAQQMADLRAGKWYINVHTTMFGGGEIRGQIYAGSQFYRAVCR